ncbi:uncharacterized protein MONBRDRAFT_23751 [Monosiga brevicollis MX1]|uniref:TauD/TfdA-like domain-containing protein n=1 Tax=Monosiga brevicollis TaxID=81824 RepID=A9UUQ7_MONBE|nr:uncharacterized protein MONBRDRAFT_23751 [Monosiga brevicollis MX1]EDQ90764.1 predicted protein [Monosiga brevicollis MX1]|eukprot:XP_001744061.1 hypothetical protein [Monosiga brevicollis MX1]
MVVVPCVVRQAARVGVRPGRRALAAVAVPPWPQRYQRQEDLPLAARLTRARADPDGHVHVGWADGTEHKLHRKWLRDVDPALTNPTSLQREATPEQLAAAHVADAWVDDQGALHVTFQESDGPSRVVLDQAWLALHTRGQRATATNPAPAWRPTPAPLSLAEIETLLPTHLPSPGDFAPRRIPRSQLLEDPLPALTAVQEDGMVIITDMPTCDLRDPDTSTQQPLIEATALAMRQFGQLQRTFYSDGLWDTAPKDAADVNDTAYTNLGLPLHTDATYMREPPGLQLFCCTAQSSDGGASLFGHVNLVLKALYEQEPDLLTYCFNTPWAFQALETNVHYHAMGPIFGAEAPQDVVMRFNPTDRAAMPQLTFDELEAYYHCLERLTALLASPKCLYHSERLAVGEMAVINNHKVLHGREAFVGHRNLVGCYVTMDEFQSRLRLAGPDQHDPRRHA